MIPEAINIGLKTVFDDAFKSYYHPLCFYAAGFVAAEDAEDLVENLFIKLWNNHQVFKSPLHLKNFLYLAVRNACLDFIKASKSADKRYHDYVAGSNTDNLQPDHLQHLIKAETFGEIYRAINDLPSQCSKVIRMSYLEGYSNKEIAKALGVSEQAIKNYKAKGLNKLKDSLPGAAFTLLLMMANWYN